MDLLRLNSAPPVSRREFLKWGSLAFLGMYLPDFYPKPAADTALHGRVLDDVVTVFDRPSFDGRFLKVVWRDLVVPIDSVTVGTEPAHNRVWYHVNGEGYVHSGSIQPVSILPNEAVIEIPAQGAL